MSEQIIKLAQADDVILNNLTDTENKLINLNQEVVNIVEGYHFVDTPSPSFFNFDNPFFLLTLAGLFLLAIALWFLRHELKHNKSKKNIKQVNNSKPESVENIAPRIVYNENKHKDESKIQKKDTHSKGRKIKVIKVK